jgi:hypothetical protein
MFDYNLNATVQTYLIPTSANLAAESLNVRECALNVLREAVDHGTFPKPLVGPGLR